MSQIGEFAALQDALLRRGRIVVRTDLRRRHMEVAQPDGRVHGIKSHESIVREPSGTTTPEVDGNFFTGPLV